MEPLLLHPDPPPPELVRALDLAGLAWKAVAEPPSGDEVRWAGAIVAADGDDDVFGFIRAVRSGDEPLRPLLLLVRGNQLAELDGRHELFDDFCVTPFHPVELEARLRHLLARAGGPGVITDELLVYDALALNLETYQAVIAGRPLDLTYMEYELLKFLASNPGRVFTRETLLSRVWGYEYYGGARTVDVHIRRLRAKLGEEHAHLIQTVRSVGYKFGERRWSAGG